MPENSPQGLSKTEQQEYEVLIAELQLSDFERRRRRLIAATAQLVKEKGEGTIADALVKARRGEPLSETECQAVNLGFTKQEMAGSEPEKQLARRKARP